MRKKGLLVFLSLVLALSLVIAGCAQPAPEEEVAPPPEEEVAPPPEEEAPPEPKVVKLGLPLSLTGLYALWGLAEKRAFELGIETVNAEGGIKIGNETYQLVGVYEDTASDPGRTLDAVYKMIFEDDIQFHYSGEDMGFAASQPLLEENGVISLLGCAAPFTGPDVSHTFRTLICTGVEASYGIYKYMMESYPDVKTVFIANCDDIQGHSAAVISRAMAEYFGLEVVAPPEYFSYSTVDFTSMATKILAANPDVLDLGATWDAFAGMLLEAVREQGGFQGKVVLDWWGGGMIVQAGFDPELVEGIISYQQDYVSEIYPPEVRELAAEYIERYGYIDSYSITFANQAFIIKSICEQAGSADKEKIYEFLTTPGVKISSPFGTYDFFGNEFWYYGIDRVLKLPIPTSVCRNGVDVTVSLMPAEEAAEIWPYLTREKFPELLK